MKKELIRAALKARENSYAPYSHYQVGAAVLTDQGEIVTGCNVENASYGACCCAERTAVFKAVSQGKTSFQAIAVAGGAQGRAPEDFAWPCGICRQVLHEFAGGKGMTVIVAKSQEEFVEYPLGELLPHGFGGDSVL